VPDKSNANTQSYPTFGSRYTNDAKLDGAKVFTSSMTFQVKEIEIFEIPD
jgi:hypothetical protein